MRFFRRKRKPAWPAELERRKPENAEHRAQLERAQRALMAIKAQIASETTQELQPKISSLRDIARVIELGSRPN